MLSHATDQQETSLITLNRTLNRRCVSHTLGFTVRYVGEIVVSGRGEKGERISRYQVFLITIYFGCYISSILIDRTEQRSRLITLL